MANAEVQVIDWYANSIVPDKLSEQLHEAHILRVVALTKASLDGNPDGWLMFPNDNRLVYCLIYGLPYLIHTSELL